MILAVEDIEDEVFWRAIFCLFPALKASQFCYSSHPAMDKIFCVHCADCALKKSMIDDECIIGSSISSALTGCDEELDEQKKVILIKSEIISQSVA